MDVSPRGRGRAGQPGLAEIARLAGVSEATVSRVLHHKAGVAERTRLRVREALRALGRPERVQDGMVLILSPGLDNPFFARMCDSLQDELLRYGMHPVVCTSRAGNTLERHQIEYFAEAGVSAVVFLSSPNILRTTQRENRIVLIKRHIPIVSLNGGFQELPSPVFSTDHAESAEMSVAHLWELGHRRIGFVAGPEGIRASDRRLAGYERALVRRGVPAAELVVARSDYSSEGGRTAALDLLDRAPEVTAVVAANDQIAFGVVDAVRERGGQVPADVSVIGYDDSPFLDRSDPPLTSVRQPTEELSQKVALTVMQMLGGQDVEPVEVLVRPELKLRRSTGLSRTLLPALPNA
ncbi:LacI family DNA-binding transcriptional regulator [Pseudonocardia sp. TRM90224]|uniref:LacI family DNA-binding transcriptional regulator n=1 Tax=Pseudonocardia sp. TRM90224 TaxID=2812678 RepID=UPI001E509479|nr:LacI family DNA-binding transcriptional regulator [Pseudonocardia sp. TRM90224]